jgi:hypothetical protein
MLAFSSVRCESEAALCERLLVAESKRSEHEKSARWPANLAKNEYNSCPITLGHEHGCIEQGTRLHGFPK